MDASWPKSYRAEKAPRSVSIAGTRGQERIKLCSVNGSSQHDVPISQRLAMGEDLLVAGAGQL